LPSLGKIIKCGCLIEYGDDIPNDIVISQIDGRNVLTNSLGESVFEDEWRNLENIEYVRVINKELILLRAGIRHEVWFDDSINRRDRKKGAPVGYIKDVDGNLVIRSNFRVIPKDVGVEENATKVIYKCKEHKPLTDEEVIIEVHKPQPPVPIDPKVARRMELDAKDDLTLPEVNELRVLQRG